MSAPSKYCRVASWQIFSHKKSKTKRDKHKKISPQPNSGYPLSSKSLLNVPIFKYNCRGQTKSVYLCIIIMTKWSHKVSDTRINTLFFLPSLWKEKRSREMDWLRHVPNLNSFHSGL